MNGIVVTQKKFADLNKKCQDYCLKNVKKYSAQKWSNKIVHPKTKEIALPVDRRVLPILKGEKLIELTKDWFSSGTIPN